MDDVVSKKQEEIIGGFVNAIGRGETLDMARITFLNAGYSREVVDTAARAVLQSNVPQGQAAGTTPVSPGLPLHAQMTPVAAPVTTPVSRVRRKGVFGSRVPYWVVILMILLALGIVVGAGVLGLFWDQLFGV